MKFNNRLLIAGFIASFFLASCAPRIVPRAGQPGLVDLRSNMITKEKDGIKVSVQSEEWQYPPYVLVDYFTPLFILIRNNTENKISVKYSGLVLFDEHGNQFDAIPPDSVEYIMLSREIYGDRYPDLYFKFEESRPPYSYGSELPAYLKKPFSNISIFSLPEAMIFPHSQVRGFVYFREALTYGNSLRLRVELDGYEDEFEFDIKR